MAEFFGRYEHAIDGKGRVILPSKFRGPFELGGFLTQYLDGCLALWTPDQFDSQMQRMRQRQSLGRSARNEVRSWSSNVSPLEIDKQGRMMIPGHLRTYASLEGDVLVLGAIDRVELWDPRRWEEKVGPEEQRLIEGADD
ncbi:MAG: cell division/cell wall cluster transcriptional repressor MraZ [Acidimicrobiales bacterium]|jgi:MraZ protein